MRFSLMERNSSVLKAMTALNAKSMLNIISMITESEVLLLNKTKRIKQMEENTMNIMKNIEHSKKQHKTRQDVFLEQYPETLIDDNGAISICPMCVSAAYRDENGCRTPIDCECADCCREFWMQEVE